MIGQRFGSLTVLERAGKYIGSDGKRINWLCKCDCGRKTLVHTSALKSGNTKSCGCLQKESQRNNGNKTIENTSKIFTENYLKEGTNLVTINCKMLKNNTSGVKGVTWNEKEQRWRARIVFKKKEIYLGRFQTLEEATQARKEAEEKYFKPILEKYGRAKED